MSTDAANIGLSGLLAAQRGLATTGHNIANVNTAGYSRQRVSFETRQPQLVGFGYVGKGVEVSAIRRLANDFLVDQVRVSTSNQAQSDKSVELLDQIDRQIGDALIVGGLQSFFNAVGDANNDPRVMATRQVVIENARAMVSRFTEQEAQMNALARNVNRQIAGTVEQVNSLTDAIARLNHDIALGSGIATGEPPNDLLDKRDQLLSDLSQLVGVQIQRRDDGMVNVLIGDGQLVVTGSLAENLTTITNTLDPSRIEISFQSAGGASQITSAVHGGELGALVAFRDSNLEPARNAIGRLALTFALAMNEQHHKGMDLNGALGGDMFSVPSPAVNAPAGNTGSIAVAYDLSNVAGLTTSDYRLTHDGSNFTLTRLTDGSTQTLSGAGPFSVDGFTITVSGAPAAGDQYLIEPTKAVPRGMRLLTTDPAGLALSSPIRTARATSNISDASISRGTVLDETNAALLTTTTLVFGNPPTTYQVNGAGPALPFTSGADIDVNGWRVQISGTPAAGDTFTVQSNAGGIGDNSNGLALSQLQFAPLMAGGTASFEESYGVLTGEVGAAAEQAHVSSQALAALTENATAARDALSGVNLEEEAANLLRFQQAFQAAAQVIRAADQAFQAIIQAVRG